MIGLALASVALIVCGVSFVAWDLGRRAIVVRERALAARQDDARIVALEQRLCSAESLLSSMPENGAARLAELEQLRRDADMRKLGRRG